MARGNGSCIRLRSAAVWALIDFVSSSNDWNTEVRMGSLNRNKLADNVHVCTLHPAIIKVFYYQLMHKGIAFKGVLKFTLKLQ